MITKERRTISVCCSLCASYNVFSRMKTAAVVCLCYFALPRRGKEETFLGGEERKGGAIREGGKLQRANYRGRIRGRIKGRIIEQSTEGNQRRQACGCIVPSD